MMRRKGPRQTTSHRPGASTRLQGNVRAPLLDWGLDDVGPALDSIDGEELAQYVFVTVKDVRPQHRSQLSLAIRHALRLFLRAHDEYVLQRAAGPDPPSLTL